MEGRQINTGGVRHPLVVWNANSWMDTDVVVIPVRKGKPPLSLRDGQGHVISAVQKIKMDRGTAYLVRPANVPGKGHAVFDLSRDAPAYNPAQAVVASGSTGGWILENRLLRVEVDQAGRISRLFDKVARREVMIPGEPANQMLLYDNTAKESRRAGIVADTAIPANVKLRLMESGPLRAALEMRCGVGRKSKMMQRIMLQAESRRIDFETCIDWQEQAVRLCALHPVKFLSARATYEAPLGQSTHSKRAYDTGDGWDKIPHGNWIDLSEADYGVALLNNITGRHFARGPVLGLALLGSKGAAKAKRGMHRFTYSLYPHPGDFRAASVVQQAGRLNHPLRVVAEPSHV